MEDSGQVIPYPENRPSEKIQKNATTPNGSYIAETVLSNGIDSKGEGDTKAKKKVNICTERSLSEETRRCSEDSESCGNPASIASNDKCLTMTGTIKRGKKAGQSLDVRLNISREELEIMEANIAAKEVEKRRPCTLYSGPHVTLFTVLCFPVAFIMSSLYSFYMGTITWYSIFTYVTEEKNIVYKLFILPFLILLYPFIIVAFTLGLGTYAAFVQVSWSFSSWQKEILDWEKGFYGWLCSVMKLEECSPYEVVVLTDIKVTSDQDKCNSQDSILT